jgi:tRNA/tmRNA/rRNA uracil-C5-methylase (TrmA/RlmC/RlmD family)
LRDFRWEESGGSWCTLKKNTGEICLTKRRPMQSQNQNQNRHRAQGASDKIIEITIDSLAFGAEGVGRTAENMAVFVEGTVPGDRVKIRLGKNKKRFASIISG